MVATARTTQSDSPHIPVLLNPFLGAVAPVRGVWLDGTFGAGSYARALLGAGAEQVIAVDRDPAVFEMAASWAAGFGDRLRLVQGSFGQLDTYGRDLDGVVLDLGVSSMQLDQSGRGFSFMRDGPLDMRMSQSGATAADLVNSTPEAELADILYLYGEERASRRIARAIVAERDVCEIKTTAQLAAIIAKYLPRPKPGQSHAATRSFQAIRIEVNDEFGELLAGLQAAERALAPGGRLAVVSFHSLEDRIVKRFFQLRASSGGGGSRHAPELAAAQPAFAKVSRAISADAAELAENPRARSARLRVAVRTDAPAGPVDRAAVGLPEIRKRRGR
jgi:16S rRNA (cytosine1402-N4)-methyltransferase